MMCSKTLTDCISPPKVLAVIVLVCVRLAIAALAMAAADSAKVFRQSTDKRYVTSKEVNMKISVTKKFVSGSLKGMEIEDTCYRIRHKSELAMLAKHKAEETVLGGNGFGSAYIITKVEIL